MLFNFFKQFSHLFLTLLFHIIDIIWTEMYSVSADSAITDIAHTRLHSLI
jgi:hypothetical protein